MGAFGARVAEVTVQSDWWSKINWTQVVGFICSGIAVITGNKMEVDAATQVSIVMTIQAIAGIVTIWFRHNSTTITPTAAARLAQGGPVSG